MKTKLIMLAIALIAICSCSKENSDIEPDDPAVEVLDSIDDLSLDYHYSTQTIVLSRDVEQEGATIELKDNSYWISRLELNGKAITFEVIENTESDRGCRYDTIEIKVNEQIIGSVCVSQARSPISLTKLAWALPEAMYSDEWLTNYQDNISGKEMTQLIYDLEKTTNGKDSYKNYPAFAYCIEMNLDPEKNLEWHLPTYSEMQVYQERQSWEDTPFGEHPIERYAIYWWAADESNYSYCAHWLNSSSPASSGGTDKTTEMWVMAFRNGAVVE